MIIVELGRGLGNSMYVYAAAFALAKHYNTQLKLNTSYLRSWPRFEKFGGEWNFELGKFNISAKEATKKEIRKFVIKTGFRPLDKLIRKYKIFERNVYKFGTFDPIEKFFNAPDDIYLWGYYGNEKFFRPVKDIIKKEFQLKEEFKKNIYPLLKDIKESNSVSIHIRRGDLVRLNALILPIEYYKKAISIINEKVEHPKFYVFSDEIGWCKKNLKLGVSLNFVEGHKGWEDLELMRNCKHNILANSALSWWAGYLNPNKRKIVIASRPFTHWINLNNPDNNIPKEWIKVEIDINEKNGK